MESDPIDYPTPREAGVTRRLASAGLRERPTKVARDGLDATGRAGDVDDVLLASVPPAARHAALEDVRSGDGGELRPPRRHPPDHPRFHSYRSSCALAVNAFGHWRLDPSTLHIAGTRGFTALRFEKKLPIGGVGRRPPNLDVWLEGPTTVAIESKLIEHLSRGKSVGFAPVYDRAVAALAHASWRDAFAFLKSRPSEYRYLRAAQLVKHYLGIKSARRVPARLVYLYWEPLDHEEHRLFRAHREEVGHFAGLLRDPDVDFAFLAYHELFEEWDALPKGASFVAHLANLRSRYELRLGGEKRA